MKSLALAAVALVATANGSSRAADQPHRPQAGKRASGQAGKRECDVALSTVKAFTARRINKIPWVVADSPIPREEGSASDGGEIVIDQWGGERPANGLVRAF